MWGPAIIFYSGEQQRRSKNINLQYQTQRAQVSSAVPWPSFYFSHWIGIKHFFHDIWAWQFLRNTGVSPINNLSLPKLILKNPEIISVVIGGKNFQTRDQTQTFTAKNQKICYIGIPSISLHWKLLGNLSSLLTLLIFASNNTLGFSLQPPIAL